MSQYGAITAQVRTDRGKGAAHTLRRSGKIPAVMYGRGQDNVSLCLDPHEFRKATDPSRQWNTFFEVTVQHDGKAPVVEPCMLADVQLDSVRRDVVHVDFLRVDPEKDIVRQVPVRFSGRAIGVFKGGKLRTYRRHVKVASRPSQVPVEIVVDVTDVDGGQSLRMKDITIEAARLVENPEQRLCFVAMPKAKPDEGEEVKDAKDAKDKKK